MLSLNMFPAHQCSIKTCSLGLVSGLQSFHRLPRWHLPRILRLQNFTKAVTWTEAMKRLQCNYQAQRTFSNTNLQLELSILCIDFTSVQIGSDNNFLKLNEILVHYGKLRCTEKLFFRFLLWHNVPSHIDETYYRIFFLTQFRQHCPDESAQNMRQSICMSVMDARES